MPTWIISSHFHQEEATHCKISNCFAHDVTPSNILAMPNWMRWFCPDSSREAEAVGNTSRNTFSRERLRHQKITMCHSEKDAIFQISISNNAPYVKLEPPMTFDVSLWCCRAFSISLKLMCQVL